MQVIADVLNLIFRRSDSSRAGVSGSNTGQVMLLVEEGKGRKGRPGTTTRHRDTGQRETLRESCQIQIQSVCKAKSPQPARANSESGRATRQHVEVKES